VTVFAGPASGFPDNPLLRPWGLYAWGTTADGLDARSDCWASDVGIDGGAASAEEAAVHIISDDREG